LPVALEPNKLFTRYFRDPHTELRRVLAWLGMHDTEDRLERACGRINPSLVHHRVTVAELVEAGARAMLWGVTWIRARRPSLRRFQNWRAGSVSARRRLSPGAYALGLPSVEITSFLAGAAGC
jgi:hypothetical protein